MDQTHVNIATAIRALKDVVAPAVDSTNARASEQLRLSVEHLGFLLDRLDYLPERHYIELKYALQLAEDVLGKAAAFTSPEKDELTRAVSSALKTLKVHNATSQPYGQMPVPLATLRRHTERINAGLSKLIQSSRRLPADVRASIEQCVIDHSAERIEFERVWYAPLGFDPHADELPDLNHWLERNSAA